MSKKADGNYFADRERSEREMSRDAPHDAAAAAHAEMAERYEALAAVFGAKQLGEVPPDYPKGEAPDAPPAENM